MTDVEENQQKSKKRGNEIFWDTCSFVSLICLFCIALKQVINALDLINALNFPLDLVNAVVAFLTSCEPWILCLMMIGYALICALIVWLAVCISKKCKGLSIILLLVVLATCLGVALLLLLPVVVISAYIPVLFLLALVVAIKRFLEVYSLNTATDVRETATDACGTTIVSKYVFEILTLAALLCALSTPIASVSGVAV